MKKILSILFTTLLIGCANSNQVYWCGDHPCVNKKEREDFFKENMTIEVKKLSTEEKKQYSEVEKVFEQAYSKKVKKRILKEKQIAKKNKYEEKEKIKEDKILAKEKMLEREKLLKKEKKLLKKNQKKKKNKVKKVESSENLLTEKNNSDFTSLVEKVMKNSLSKPYPDLNDVKD